ncbi:N-acetylglucosamine-6-phosphate deacetylase [Jatrophihabitans sp. YIM 134969]
MGRRLGVAAALVGDRLLPGDVTVADGRVEAVGLASAGRTGLAVPGLVDLQVNGYVGVDVAGATPDGLRVLRRALARDGVTAFAPTVVTGPFAATSAALATVAQCIDEAGSARVLGVHLEGPWLAPERLGIHPAAHRRDPEGDAALLERYLTAGPVRIVTLAPERPGAAAFVERLVAAGVVVLLGHSDATVDQARAAFTLGAAGVTHLFNAMAPWHHRAPGLAGGGLAHRGAVLTVIADGHHLAPEVLATAFAAAPGRVGLVTDATAAAGMPDGAYVLGEVPVTVTGGVVRGADGILAGSAATLVGCVRHTVAAGVDLTVALTAATRVPADLVGRPDLGRLHPGAPADVVVLDDALEVTSVLIGGAPVPDH